MKKLIWISSYPKSGNTFLRTLLSTYFYSSEGVYNQKLLDKINEYPRDFFEESNENNLEKESKLWKKKQGEINDREVEFIFLKTHLASLLINNKYKTIDNDFTKCIFYIYRDPRNVVLSLRDFFDIKISEAVKYILNKKNIIYQKNKNSGFSKSYTPILDWESNYISYKINSEFIPTLFIKYEELAKNTEEEFLKILKFLKNFVNFEIDILKLKKVVKNTSFSNLKSIEESEGFYEKQKMGILSSKKPFFSLGIKRNYKEELNSNDEVLIKTSFLKTINELRYQENK